MNLKDAPHRRFNVLTGEWVLDSAQRTKRPWQGKVESPPAATRPAYDAHCYLYPGNLRAGGQHNPAYTSTFVFENDFAALAPVEPQVVEQDGFLLAKGERLVLANEHFVLLVPYWAAWHFECMIVPWCHQQDIGQITAEEQRAFAEILQQVTIRLAIFLKLPSPTRRGFTSGQRMAQHIPNGIGT